MIKVNPAYLLLLLISAETWSMERDREQPISVEAVSLEIRESDNISIYEGKVRLSQGSLQASAQRMVVHVDANRELESIQMTGKPASFRQLDDQQREMIGRALRIDYYQAGAVLVLTGDAFYQHNGDIIESSVIEIKTDTSDVQARSDEADQRVKMLIQPKQE